MSVLADATGFLGAAPYWLGFGTGLDAWMGVVRQVANIVIVVSNVALAHGLLGLARRDMTSLMRRRLVTLLAFLMAGCGAIHLALVLAYPTPARPMTTVLKVLVGGYWIVVSLRFPAAVAAPVRLPRRFRRREAPAPIPALLPEAPEVEPAALAVDMREHSLRNEQWLLDKTETIRRLRDILSDTDLGDSSCKISSGSFPTGPAPSP